MPLAFSGRTSAIGAPSVAALVVDVSLASRKVTRPHAAWEKAGREAKLVAVTVFEGM